MIVYGRDQEGKIMRYLTMDFFLSLMITFFVVGILSQILIGVLYQHMIEEAENMQNTTNKLMQQLKQKYKSNYAMNEGVTNVPVFVDKFINRLQIGKVSLNTLKNFSGQSMLLSVVAAGAGICKGLAEGKAFFSLVPYYVITFLGLYLYFSVLSIVDIPARKNMLKTNLVEYFENQMTANTDMAAADSDMSEIRDEQNEQEKEFERKRMPAAAENMEFAAERNGRREHIRKDRQREEARQGEDRLGPRDLDWTKTESEKKTVYLSEEQERELADLLRDFLS